MRGEWMVKGYGWRFSLRSHESNCIAIIASRAMSPLDRQVMPTVRLFPDRNSRSPCSLSQHRPASSMKSGRFQRAAMQKLNRHWTEEDTEELKRLHAAGATAQKA